jgi:hypothetical protein
MSFGCWHVGLRDQQQNSMQQRANTRVVSIVSNATNAVLTFGCSCMVPAMHVSPLVLF